MLVKNICPRPSPPAPTPCWGSVARWFFQLTFLHPCCYSTQSTLSASAAADSASAGSAEAGCTMLSAVVSGPGGQTPLLQRPNTATFSAQLTAAGMHALSVCLTDTSTQQLLQLQPATQLRGVTVVPAPVCPERTVVEAMPDRLVAGVAHTFHICPVDAFGNARASGCFQPPSVTIHVMQLLLLVRASPQKPCGPLAVICRLCQA